MQPTPNHPDQDPTASTNPDEAQIAQAWQEQLAQASSSARMRHAPPTLYGRFAAAYRDLLALSRVRRRKLLRGMGMSLAGAALAFALASGHIPTVRAAGISVTGGCTLVDAITAANSDTATGGCSAGSGADTITLSGNVTLTAINDPANDGTGLPFITSAITIEGNGFTISRDPGAPNFRILSVQPGGNLTVRNITITGGSNITPISGSGIYNADGGTLTVSDSTISGNTGKAGGGIFNDGTLTVANSTISGNTGDNGGGITNGRGAGGPNSAVTTVTNSTISNNTGIQGGGLHVAAGTMTLINSTVSDNTAVRGGGSFTTLNFSTPSTLTLERSLISGNTASQSGNEVFNDSYYSSYYGNTSFGIVNAANFNVFGHNGESNAQAFVNFTPSGSDITATSDGSAPTGLAAILNTTLANNGGPTFTHALVAGSPALDAAPTGPATDQRGVARPQGAAFDIGAFELVPAANTAPVATNDSYTTNEDTALSVPAPGVLGNDGDADSDPLTALLVSGPAHGTLTLNPNGSFTYTPNANYSGADSFTYKANDGTSASNVATVSLTVVSALGQIDQLLADVQVLVDSGSLNGGQGNALIIKLEHAAGYVDNGQEAQAIRRMRTFISQVSSFISNGVLTSAEGQPLIDKANAIIHSLGG